MIPQAKMTCLRDGSKTPKRPRLSGDFRTQLGDEPIHSSQAIIPTNVNHTTDHSTILQTEVYPAGQIMALFRQI